MTDLKQILTEEYQKQISNIDLKTLVEMIQDVLESPSEIKEDIALPQGAKFDPQEMLLKMIPDIAVSEIGWSDVRTIETDEGKKQIVSGPQRKLLEDYLANIKGDDLAAKIDSLSKFYSEGADLIKKQSGSNRTRQIVQAVSYLVFYKTLTKIITNFNASSAGFSFESFLATLVKGEQIEAQSGTIADYIDRASGKDIPVSLKLYQEGSLEVEGSYSDLVNDLVNPQFEHPLGNAMRYVVCTKNLSGKRLKQKGKINFHQFDFTLNNVCDILLKTKKWSQICIRLPKVVVSGLSGGQQSGISALLALPEKDKMASPQELEQLFIGELSKQIKKLKAEEQQSPLRDFGDGDLKELVYKLDWAKNDDLFNTGDRGVAKMSKTKVLDFVKSKYDQAPQVVIALLKDAIIDANQKVVDSQKAKAKDSKRKLQIQNMVAQGDFFSPEESARQYKMLGFEQKKIALQNSLGYLRNFKFSLNKTQALAPSEPTNTLYLGSINVGTAHVVEALGKVKDILNEEVYEIFQSLKILSDSLNSYFAGGLKDDNLAKTSVDNAKNIETKEILRSKK